MNKLSRTSYSRNFNWEGLPQRTKEKKTEGDSNEMQEQSYFTKNKIVNNPNSTRPLQRLVERKIEIDPKLLMSAKPNYCPGSLSKYGRGVQNKRELSSTFTESFGRRERPESKKFSHLQPFTLTKPTYEPGGRPQTSKGQRNVAYNRETFDYDEPLQEIKRETKTSYGSRKNKGQFRASFGEGIDEQFLGLFAK